MLGDKGVIGEIKGSCFWLGSHAFAHEKRLCNNKSLHEQTTKLGDNGFTLIFVGNDRKIIGAIAIQDGIKDNISKLSLLFNTTL
ncbi:hypothetical protein [Francisella halioticida]|uniref:hypothetical protein n=1 Tax=Francisella halioticida TaxID=549298 RepID=UPI001FE5C88C|nr:hypothetical protein [Francisella halioticida]